MEFRSAQSAGTRGIAKPAPVLDRGGAVDTALEIPAPVK
jgi:hypothetical protein